MIYNPLVSIIIRNYNRDLRKTVIPSLRNQGLGWLEQYSEIQVVDDGSSHTYGELGYVKLMELLPETYNFYFQGETQGCARAANRGLTPSYLSKYIAFLDTDDTWNNHYLTKQIENLEVNPTAVFSVALSSTLTLPPDNLLERLINFPWITTPSAVVFRRETLFNIGQPIFNPSYKICSDRDVYIRLLMQYGKDAWCYLDDTRYPLIERHQDKDSLTLRPENQQIWRDERNAIRETYRFVTELS